MKKAWKRPQLVVLVRGNREERVLAACKGGLVNGPGGGSSVLSDY
jgi:hypothetical protein